MLSAGSISDGAQRAMPPRGPRSGAYLDAEGRRGPISRRALALVGVGRAKLFENPGSSERRLPGRGQTRESEARQPPTVRRTREVVVWSSGWVASLLRRTVSAGPGRSTEGTAHMEICRVRSRRSACVPAFAGALRETLGRQKRRDEWAGAGRGCLVRRKASGRTPGRRRQAMSHPPRGCQRRVGQRLGRARALSCFGRPF